MLTEGALSLNYVTNTFDQTSSENITSVMVLLSVYRAVFYA